MNIVDNAIRKKLKLILAVPNNCNTSYLYTPRAKGDCGLKCLQDEYVIQSITHAFRMLTCRDNLISDIAKSSLITSAKHDYPQNTNINLANALSWLSTKTTNTRGSSGGTRSENQLALPAIYIIL